MSKKTRSLTLSALFSALAIISLYIASVLPTGQLGLTAVASLFVAAAIIESGLLFGLYVFIVSSVISIIIVPNRITPILFILFFGYYPIIKSLIEKQKNVVIQIVAKFIVFNIALMTIWLLFSELVLAFLPFDLSLILIILIANIIFILFDYGFTKLIWFYIQRISEFKK